MEEHPVQAQRPFGRWRFFGKKLSRTSHWIDSFWELPDRRLGFGRASWNRVEEGGKNTGRNFDCCHFGARSRVHEAPCAAQRRGCKDIKKLPKLQSTSLNRGWHHNTLANTIGHSKHIPTHTHRAGGSTLL